MDLTSKSINTNSQLLSPITQVKSTNLPTNNLNTESLAAELLIKVFQQKPVEENSQLRSDTIPTTNSDGGINPSNQEPQIVAEINNVAPQKPAEMAVPLSEMLKQVNNTIPLFLGGSGANSQQYLGEFIDCCEILHRSYTTGINEPILGQNNNQFLSLLKSRFRGDAYDLVNRSTFENYDQLKKLLYRTYLPTWNLVEMTEEMQRARQLVNETTKEFRRRLSTILNDWSVQIKKTTTQRRTTSSYRKRNVRQSYTSKKVC